MKKHVFLSNIPLLVLAAGLAGFFARAALYLLGRDASGLLVPRHPLHILCWVLTAAVTLCLGVIVWKQEAANDYTVNFPKNTRVLHMAIIAAAGICATVLTNLNPLDKLNLVWSGLGLLSAPALVVVGICRATDKRPKYFLYGVLCLFYAVHMICCYKSWSSNPQVADYCFSLLSCACLTISAYQRTAFSAGVGHRRVHLFFCLMAGFFCILCLPGSEHPWLYLTNGCFFLSDLAMSVPHTPDGEE